jgi:hypothetical protein
MKNFAIALVTAALGVGSVADATDYIPPQSQEECHLCGTVQSFQIAYDDQQRLTSLTYVVAMGGGPETRSVTYDSGDIPAIRPGTSVQVSDDGKSIRPLN